MSNFHKVTHLEIGEAEIPIQSSGSRTYAINIYIMLPPFALGIQPIFIELILIAKHMGFRVTQSWIGPWLIGSLYK